MKGLALVLLCVVAAAQARSAGVKNAGSLAALGENPWFVHLRVAVGTSGFLVSCAGTLIDPRWVLTSSSCVTNSRFIWVRYGVVDVYRPSLVTETTNVFHHFRSDIALIRLNRHVLNPPNANIAVAALPDADAEVPSTGTFCGFGATESGNPGEELSCADVAVSVEENGNITAQSDEQQATRFDFGAPLVQDGVLYGILVHESDDEGTSEFLNVESYLDWIEFTAGISLSRASIAKEEPTPVLFA